MKLFHAVFGISALSAIATVVLLIISLSSGPDPILVALLIAFWVIPPAALAICTFVLGIILKSRHLPNQGAPQPSADGDMHRPAGDNAHGSTDGDAGRLWRALGWIWLAAVAGHVIGFSSNAPSFGSLGAISAMAVFCIKGLPGLVLLAVGYRIRRAAF